MTLGNTSISLVTSTLAFRYLQDNMDTNTTLSHDAQNGSNNTTAWTRDETLANIEITVLATILFMALFGNIVVVVVLMYHKRKLSRMQLFIIHLCLADISVGLFQVLPQLMMDITFRFDGNNFLCKLVKYLQVGTMYSSTYVLIMTALDRYMSICHPLTSQTWTTRRVHVMTLIAWLLAGLFALPQLFIFSYKQRPYDGVYDCLDNFDLDNAYWTLQLYITWIFMSVYVIPFVVLTACYSKICHIVWVSARGKETASSLKQKSNKKKSKKNSMQSNGNYSPIGAVRNPRAHSKKISKSKIKTVKLTLIVVLCFIICWAPFFITQMLSAFDPTAPYFTSKLHDYFNSQFSISVSESHAFVIHGQYTVSYKTDTCVTVFVKALNDYTSS